MKNGKCPKCGSTEVYTGQHLNNMTKLGSNWSNSIPITMWSVAPLDNYVCVDCGYVESYLSNPVKRRRITEKWPRAGEPKGLTSRRTCPYCKNRIDDDWKTCPYCGQALT